MDDFTSPGLKQEGTATFTPTGGQGLWLTRNEADEAQKRWGYQWGTEWDFWDMSGDKGCPWAGHGLCVLSEALLVSPEVRPSGGTRTKGRC